MRSNLKIKKNNALVDVLMATVKKYPQLHQIFNGSMLNTKLWGKVTKDVNAKMKAKGIGYKHFEKYFLKKISERKSLLSYGGSV
jgi:hypothetical protein